MEYYFNVHSSRNPYPIPHRDDVKVTIIKPVLDAAGNILPERFLTQIETPWDVDAAGHPVRVSQSATFLANFAMARLSNWPEEIKGGDVYYFRVIGDFNADDMVVPQPLPLYAEEAGPADGIEIGEFTEVDKTDPLYQQLHSVVEQTVVNIDLDPKDPAPDDTVEKVKDVYRGSTAPIVMMDDSPFLDEQPHIDQLREAAEKDA